MRGSLSQALSTSSSAHSVTSRVQREIRDKSITRKSSPLLALSASIAESHVADLEADQVAGSPAARFRPQMMYVIIAQ
jgi:hypothetical protein